MVNHHLSLRPHGTEKTRQEISRSLPTERKNVAFLRKFCLAIAMENSPQSQLLEQIFK